MSKKTYLTKKGYEKLKKELDYLKRVKKPEISKRIGTAADHGDLSENFEYDSAKEALTQVMMRIRDISYKLSTAELIDNGNISSDKVYAGASVKLKDMKTGEEITYTITGADEADPMENKISVESPVSQGLIGKSAGETAEIKVPRGTMKYKILEISR